jgi:hypothetical protein
LRTIDDFLKELGGSTGAGLRPFKRLGKPTLIWKTIYHELRRWAKASGGALSTGRDSIPVRWPRVANATDVITYDVIRMTTAAGIGQNVAGAWVGWDNADSLAECGRTEK